MSVSREALATGTYMRSRFGQSPNESVGGARESVWLGLLAIHIAPGPFVASLSLPSASSAVAPTEGNLSVGLDVTNGTPEYDYDVMLSYQSADEEGVRSLGELIEAETLNGRPLRVWFASWDVKQGGNIVTGINQGLEKSRFIALCLSDDALSHEWPEAEQSAAIWMDPSGRRGRILTLLFKDCQLPPLLRFRKYIDMRDKKFPIGVQVILAILKDQPLPRGKTSRYTGTDVPSRQTAIELLEPTTLDPLPEPLVLNLFPVLALPQQLFKADTNERRWKDILAHLGPNSVPPGAILYDGSLYSFQDPGMQDNPLRPFVVTDRVSVGATRYWMDSEEGRRRLVELLNRTMIAHARSKGLLYDERGHKFYYDKKKADDLGTLKSHKRSTGKSLVLTYDKARGGRGMHAHRGMKFDFDLIGNDAFLQVESGWVFTEDGSTPLTGREAASLNTRFMSQQFNRANLKEVLFLAWLLAESGSEISADLNGNALRISTAPVQTTIAVGIFGDQPEIPPANEVPDFEEGQTLTEDDGGDDDAD
jgi:hypothetical protein